MCSNHWSKVTIESTLAKEIMILLPVMTTWIPAFLL